MQALIKQFWYICVLRDGPQELPVSKPLLQRLIILHLLLGSAYLLPTSSPGFALQSELAALLFTLVVTRLLLGLAKKPERFEQAASAMLGSDVLIILIAIPCYLFLVQGLQLQELWDSVELLLILWSYVVAAHIFRHMLDGSFWLGLFLSFMYFISAQLFLLLVQVMMLSLASL